MITSKHVPPPKSLLNGWGSYWIEKEGCWCLNDGSLSVNHGEVYEGDPDGYEIIERDGQIIAEPSGMP